MAAAGSMTLADLRDIRLPEAVGFWPPAPGWWVVAGLVLLIALGVMLFRWRRRIQRESWNASAGRELADLEAVYARDRDATGLAADLSALLRRAALARYPEEGVAALHGDDWFDLLCTDSEQERSRSPQVIRELTRAAYAGESEQGEANPDDWFDFVRSWIEEAA